MIGAILRLDILPFRILSIMLNKTEKRAALIAMVEQSGPGGSPTRKGHSLRKFMVVQLSRNLEVGGYILVCSKQGWRMH